MKPTKRKLVILIAILLSQGILLWYLTSRASAAPWSTAHSAWQKRKQLTLTNNSGSTLNANVTYQVTIDTATLFSQRSIKTNCDDLRVVYQPDNSTNTELKRAIAYAQGATDCRDSYATIVSFPLQANITNGSSSTAYYIYYDNPGSPAYAASDALAAYNIGNKAATFVAPFNGTTTALAAGSGTPTTATGTIRYSGAKSALSFDNAGDNEVNDNGTQITNIGNYATIEMWINYKGIKGGLIGGGMALANYLDLFIADDSTVHLRYFNDANNNSVTLISGTTLTPGWHHVAVVIDRQSAGNSKIYFDGTNTSATWDQVPSYSSITLGIRMGSSASEGVGRFIGVIDEVRVSNVARYSANFTPQTSPFVRDANTRLLFHFDENGDDPRLTGKVIDDSGNNVHALLNGAKYVSGVIGVDSSTSDTGNTPIQSYAGHQGIYAEEGTTNKITNPSFENGTFNTNWTASGGTATANTTAPFYKFGSTSYKIVLSDATDQTVVTSINVGNTSTHTLSAYIYRGTSGNIGGTVDATVAKLVYNGSAQTTTYTNIGGGWWRLSYSAAGVNSAVNYGVQILENSSTLYIDGVQLEQTTGATSYADGSLGTGYAWTGTANNSTSTRTVTDLRYSEVSNLNPSAGTISLWVKPNRVDDSFGMTPFTTITDAGINFQKIKLKYYGATNNGSFSTVDSSGSTKDFSFTFVPTVNKWYHFVFTWGSSGASCAGYVNSSVNSSTSGTGNCTFTAFDDLSFYDPGGETNNTIISDVRIYSSALTSTEVADLYNAGLGAHSEGGEVSKDKPVLHWKFDEGTGTTAQDSSGNNNTGTVTNAVYDRLTTSDRNINQFALKFDGTGDYVSKPYSFDTELNPGTDSFTVSSWFKHSSTAPPSGTHTLISRYSAGGYKVYMNTSGFMCFGIDSDSSWTPSHAACSGSAQGSYADSKWHHLEGTKDVVNNKLTLYIDGAQVDQKDITDTASLSGSSPTFYAGIDSDGSSNAWVGFTDDVKYWGVLRSADQVKSDYTVAGVVKGVSTQIGDQGSLASGLVGYWKMDENVTGNNQTLSDLSGNAFNMTTNYGANASGVDCTKSGKYGKGCTYDGQDDKTTASDNSILRPANNFTISAWVKPSSTSGNPAIIRKGGTNGFEAYTLDIISGQWRFFIRTGTCQVCGISTGTPSTTTWTHLVGTYDGTQIILYINGVMSGTTAASGTITQDGSNGLGIGNAPDGWNLPWNGLIDEARIYNRALSPAEVSQLYNWTPGPVGYWKMDEGSGTTANDISGNGNTGTLVRSNWTSGQYGKAANFNGTSDTISIANESNFDFERTNSFSISAWSKTSNTGTQIIFGKMADSGNYTGYELFIMSNVVYFQLINTWPGNQLIVHGSTIITDGKWHYVSATYDGSSSAAGVRLYVDGNLETIGVTSDILSASVLNNITPYIGSRNNTAYYHAGVIDDVKVYNYVRTQKQVVSDMNAGHPNVGSPVGSPLLHWKFDEGYGTTAYNSGNAGSTLNGTLTSNPRWNNSGKFGKALTFINTGSNGNRVEVTNSALQVTQFTVSAWFNRSGNCGFNDCGVVTEGESSNQGWGMRVNNGNKAMISIKDCLQCINGTTVFQTGTWYHILATVDGSYIKIYVNGILENSAAQTQTPGYVGQPFKVGNKNDGNDVTANGIIDEVKFYNYAMTDDEIKLEYNQGKSLVLGSLTTDTDTKTASNAASRSYCPPGNTEGNCAAGQNPAPGGHWQFENISGTNIFDISGNNNIATYFPDASNLKTGIGKYGKSLFFNGVDSVVNIPDASSIKNSNTLSFFTWLKLTGSLSATIATKIQSGVSSWRLDITSGGELQFIGDPDGNPLVGNSCTITSTNASLQKDIWYDVGFVFSSGTVTLYKNGQPLSTSSSGSCATLYDTATAIQLGGAFDTNNFTGYLDETRIYTYSRTPAQVAWDYNRGRPVAWYKFDECTGTTLYDSSGNGNTGTWNGSGGGTQTSTGNCTTNASTAWYNGRVGKFGSSLKFDGTDDYISGPDLDFASTPFTVSAWFKVSAAPSSSPYTEYPVVIKTSNFSDTNYYITITPTLIRAGVYDSAYRHLDISNTPYLDNNWHLVTLVVDTSNHYLYMDGKLVQSATHTFPLATNNNTLKVGLHDANTAWDMNGQIDDVRIYNYPLTIQQVQLLYNGDAAVRFAPITGSP